MIQSPDGQEVSLPLHQLSPEDRTAAIRLAAEKEAQVGVMPEADLQKAFDRFVR